MAKATRSIVIGTAGHIDHGKTSLVRALTGRDTDRLPEEKSRGITIELGFAPWQVDRNLTASIVDVPGHEGFVRTMVAGAGGIDVMLLVVSAEDGVMPQTREHVHVCKLLGVRAGVVALTKTDLLDGDEDTLALLTQDIQEFVASAGFVDLPIVGCSAQTGDGLPELTRAVRQAIAALPRRDAAAPAIVPIDRAFTMKGHGTVVTGTMLQGAARLEDELSLIPARTGREEQRVRARAFQVRGESTTRIKAGDRVAANLGGIDLSQISRGDVLASDAAVVRSPMLLARVSHLSHAARPWKRGSTAVLCVGTAHTTVTLDPLQGDIAPGAHGLARLRLDDALPLWRGAKMILRAFQDPADLPKAAAAPAGARAGKTIGGGTVVDPAPSHRRRPRAELLALAAALDSPDESARLVALLEDAGVQPIARSALALRAGVPDPAPLLRVLAQVHALADGTHVLQSAVDAAADATLALLDEHRETSAVDPGLASAQAESQLRTRFPDSVTRAAVEACLSSGRVVQDKKTGKITRPEDAGDDAAVPPAMAQILELYRAGQIKPPTVKDVEVATSRSRRETLTLISALHRRGELVRVSDELSFARDAHDTLVAKIRSHLERAGDIDVQALKGLTGLSRKYAVPLLEHTDHLGITRREGDVRMPGPKA